MSLATAFLYQAAVSFQCAPRHMNESPRQVKSITLKNVSFVAHRLFYHGCDDLSGAFAVDTALSSAGTLISPGMVATVNITFATKQHTPLTATLAFSVDQSSDEDQFSVALSAAPPSAALAFPAAIDVGLVAVGGCQTVSVTLSNLSRALPTTWQLQCAAPFMFEPAAGHLAPGGSCSVAVSVAPTRAGQHAAAATLKFDAGEDLGAHVIALAATAKLPSVRPALGVAALDFAAVPLRARKSLTCPLYNCADVPASVSLRLADAVGFSVSPTHAIIAPHDTLVAEVEFHASACAGAVSRTLLQVDVAACGALSVPCQASVAAPNVVASVTLIERFPTTFTMTNKGTLATTFEFEATPPGSTFAIAPATGHLPPLATVNVTVTCGDTTEAFWPVQCAVRHQSPLVISLLRSATVTREHVASALSLQLAGFAKTSLSTVGNLIADGRIRPSTAGCWTKCLETQSAAADVPSGGPSSSAIEREKSPARSSLSAAVALRRTSAIPNPAAAVVSTNQPPPAPSLSVVVDADALYAEATVGPAWLSFGVCPAASRRLTDLITPQTVTVSNLSSAAALCVKWATPEPSLCVVIAPAGAVVAPGQQAIFTVHFRPMLPDAIYAGQLEFFLQFSELGSLPWREPVHIMGQTFASWADGATSVHLVDPAPPTSPADPRTLVMPNGEAGLPSQESFTLRNSSDVPVHVKWGVEREKVGAADILDVRVMPRTALLQPNSTVVFTVSVSTTNVGTFGVFLMPWLNGMLAPALKLFVSGVVSQPAVTVTFGNMRVSSLDFPPALQGQTVSQTLTLSNHSSVAAQFQFASLSENSPFGLSTLAGFLAPMDSCTQVCSFTPTGVGNALETVTCAVTAARSDSLGVGVCVTLRGQGVSIPLACAPSNLNLDSLVVGTLAASAINVSNPSPVSMAVLLAYTGDLVVRMSPAAFILPPCSSQLVTMTVSALQSGPATAQFFASVQPEAEGLLVAKSCAKTQTLLSIVAKAVVPQLRVVDIAARDVPAKRLWRTWHVNELNARLAGESFDESDTPSKLDFGYLSQFNAGGEQCFVRILFANDGPCPVSWAITFPDDVNYQPEPWARDTAPSPAQQAEIFVLKHGVFAVSPKRGTLASNETASIIFAVSRQFAGTFGLAATLAVVDGPQLPLWLAAQVSPMHSSPIGCLVLPEATDAFLDVSCVAIEPPIQHLEVWNAGSAPLSFEIDLSPLVGLRAVNYGHDIFDLSTSVTRATLLPGAHVLLNCRFWPLEAKDYNIVLPVTSTAEGGPFSLYLSGKGVVTRARSPTVIATLPVMPAWPRLPAVELASLSLVELDFGILPACGIAHRLVHVVNRHTSMAMTFEWSRGALCETVTIFPVSGIVAAGASLACRVIFSAVAGLRIYDTLSDLVCHCRFPIAAPELPPAVVLPKNSTLNRFVPLPPISQSLSVSAAPQTQLKLFLGVTGRVVTPDEVADHGANNVFVNRSMGPAATTATLATCAWRDAAETVAVTDLLSELLQQVLGDAGFSAAIDAVCVKVPLHFQQLASPSAPQVEPALGGVANIELAALLESILAVALAESIADVDTDQNVFG